MNRPIPPWIPILVIALALLTAVYFLGRLQGEVNGYQRGSDDTRELIMNTEIVEIPSPNA